MSRIKTFMKQDHVDVTIRITIISMLGYILGVARLPEIIPPSQASLIGWSVGFLATMLPALPLITAAGLATAFLTFFGLVSATMLLAVTVGGGNGALTGVFGAYALVTGSLRFYPSSGSYLAILIIITVLNVLAFYEVVQMRGMNFVTGLWTETGLENSLAVVSNTMIAYGWIVACLTIVPLLPPWHTGRVAIYKGLLPSLLNDTAQHIRLNLKNEECAVENSEEQGCDCDDGGLELLDPEEKQPVDAQIVERITRSAVMLEKGKIAGMTAFEPRFLRFAPPSCSYIILSKLCLVVRDISLRALTASKVSSSKNIYPPSYSEVAEALDECANQLRKGEPIEVKDDDDNAESILRDPEDPYLMKRKVGELRKTIAAWLDELGPADRTVSKYCSKEALKATWMNTLPWLLLIFGILKVMFIEMPKHFLKLESWKRIVDPTSNNGTKAAWVIKHTIGATALLSMSIFWEAYKDWELIQGAYPGSHFQGWAIIAFHVTSTQTTEGTVKKGLLRLFATCCGGFSGWLCLTAVDDNPYGMVAWLTVTTAVAAFLGTQRGFAARLGLSKDHGYANQAFILTQAIIVIYFRNQENVTRDELVVNRIVANCLGIGVGILMSLIPPNIWGGDPTLGLKIVRIQKNALAKIVRLLIERSTDSFEDETFIQESINLIEQVESAKETSINPLFAEANDFILDSTRFSTSPIFRVDPRLKAEIAALGIYNSVVTTLADVAKSMMSRTADRAVFASGMPLHNDLVALLEFIEKNDYEEPSDEENDSACGSVLIGPPLFVEIVRVLVTGLHRHEATLSKIKYGYGSSVKKN